MSAVGYRGTFDKENLEGMELDLLRLRDGQDGIGAGMTGQLYKKIGRMGTYTQFLQWQPLFISVLHAKADIRLRNCE